MAKPTDPTPDPFVYPKTAREIQRPQSPLVGMYKGYEPYGCYVARSGVVTSLNLPPAPPKNP